MTAAAIPAGRVSTPRMIAAAARRRRGPIEPPTRKEHRCPSRRHS